MMISLVELKPHSTERVPDGVAVTLYHETAAALVGKFAGPEYTARLTEWLDAGAEGPLYVRHTASERVDRWTRVS